MMRFVVIATMRRGVVEPHEPLGDAGQYRANRAELAQVAEDDAVLRNRATLHYQLERDPLPWDEGSRRGKPIRACREDEMLRLAGVCR
jgi:hypothetical protein